MNNAVELFLLAEVDEGISICNIHYNKAECAGIAVLRLILGKGCNIYAQDGEPSKFDGMSSAVAEVVDPHNLMPIVNESADCMEPDESGCPGNENFHILKCIVLLLFMRSFYHF